MAARNVPGPQIVMTLRHWFIAVSAFSFTCGAYAQAGASEITTHQYGSALQRNLNAAITPPAGTTGDASQRCRELAKTYADSIGPQQRNAAAAGGPINARDGRNVESESDLAARNRRSDAQVAYRDSGCH
jgi:hypothetical protein